MPTNNLEEFLKTIHNSLNNNDFIKITLSNKRIKSSDLKTVFAKVVSIKSGIKLSFVYRYPTKDITKNFDFTESIQLIEKMLKTDFFQADLFTSKADWHLITNENNNVRITQKPASIAVVPAFLHDVEKNRLIDLENNVYLQELGIATSDWKIKKDMQDKFRQINKYIEIVDGIINSASLPASFSIVDMGSGKGYLTFALYDYLTNKLKLNPSIVGIELRKELVDNCNAIAKKAGFANLSFQAGTNETAELSSIDMLIALHACDTATDEAIFRGIKMNAKVIICAPCCHKQIRKQINPTNELKEITKHGILLERQAEIITDAIRSLILEAYGYKTKVFEFISTEHTPKNVLIVGVKKNNENTINQEVLTQITAIKKLYNIDYHHLEKLLK